MFTCECIHTSDIGCSFFFSQLVCLSACLLTVNTQFNTQFFFVALRIGIQFNTSYIDIFFLLIVFVSVTVW